ncbi:hypothetical protein Tco_0179173 [Tanacetum coccineum]
MEERRSLMVTKLKMNSKEIRNQIIKLQKKRWEAQTAAIASASNPNNLTGTPTVKTGNYKEFISNALLRKISNHLATGLLTKQVLSFDENQENEDDFNGLTVNGVIPGLIIEDSKN